MADRGVVSGAVESAQVPDDEGCEKCGQTACECAQPLGQCCACDRPIFEGDRWHVDSDGDHWCARCYPGMAS